MLRICSGARLRVLLLVLLSELPRSLAGGGQKWYKEEYEYSFVEMLILTVLVFMALGFEFIWHRVMHKAEHSYSYGELHELVDRANAGGTARPHGEVRHLQLMKELVNRAGGEFMTLGFLACCVYFCNQAGIFDLLTRRVPSTDRSFHYPATKEDWLHMAENVHMKLFFAMVCYFVLMSRLARGSLKRIRMWEQARLRRFNPTTFEVNTVETVQAMDSDLADHILWRRYFIAKMVRWQQRSPEVFQMLTNKLGLDMSHGDFTDQFYQLLDSHFSFSCYLSLNVESGVRDSIQVHVVTWSALIVLFLSFALLHRFAKLALVSLMPALSFLAVTVLVLMKLLVRRTKASITRRCHDPKLLDLRVGDTPKGTTRFGERHRTELFALRMLQVVLFLISYLFARTVLDFHDWATYPETSLLYTSLFALLFAALAYNLPSSVPLFLGIMSLPPNVDRSNFNTFCAVLLEKVIGDPQKERELVAAKARLSRGGTQMSGLTSQAFGDTQKKANSLGSATTKNGSSCPGTENSPRSNSELATKQTKGISFDLDEVMPWQIGARGCVDEDNAMMQHISLTIPKEAGPHDVKSLDKAIGCTCTSSSGRSSSVLTVGRGDGNDGSCKVML